MKQHSTLLILALTLAATTSNAQTNTPTLEFALDSTPVMAQFDPSQWSRKDSVHGYIKNLAQDSVYFTLNRTGGMQWIINPFIDGKVLRWSDDTIGIAPSETIPVMIQFLPYPTGPDTESACFTAIPVSGLTAETCVPAYMEALSRVTDLPIESGIILRPNPANEFISMHNLPATRFDYKIISTNGNEIEAGSIAADDRIEIGKVPTGAYWFVLTKSGHVITQEPFTVLR